MAFFDYRCRKCGEVIETNRLMPPSCPKCGVPMKRVYTPTPNHFHPSKSR